MPATTHPIASVSGTQCESEKLHKDSIKIYVEAAA